MKNFILLGDIHKSIYFISWKEPQLNLLAKDFGALDCLATEFLIDGSTLSLVVSDDQKNVQVSCVFTLSLFCRYNSFLIILCDKLRTLGLTQPHKLVHELRLSKMV